MQYAFSFEHTQVSFDYHLFLLVSIVWLAAKYDIYFIFIIYLIFITVLNALTLVRAFQLNI